MAESAVRSSVDVLGRILVEEGKYLWGVEGKVEELRDELLWMRSFLRKADTLQYKDDIVWMWVCQVQKYVSEAEDIVDEFFVKVVSRRHQHGFLGKLRRYSRIFRELYDLHQTASSIDSLTVKISTLSPKLEKYGLMKSLGMSTDQAEEARIEQIHHIQRNVHMEDKKIVGLDKSAKEIIHILKHTPPDKRFHAIYGMGGSGKTTLATKVYKHEEIKQHFPGGQAFVYISKQFHFENVLQDLLRSLKHETDSSEENLSRHELVLKLQESLRKKCLVVLDDVWSKEAWDSLKVAFALCEGDLGSKLLLTTRKEDVAKYVDPDALQKPDLLNENESWELLRESVGSDLEESSTHEHDRIVTVENNEASEKVKLGRKMLKVCKGVPLAIVVLGGILRKKRTLTEWKSVLNNISSHLIRGYDHGRSCKEIVLQSYDDLPYHLKPCFLHLAHFPEDHKIQTENLYWMWAAEGLATSDRRRGKKSPEDVGNDYLSELAQAGLVQIVGMTSHGWIKSVRMHDLVRDVCLEKATADNFIQTIDLRSCSADQQLNSLDNYYNEKRLLRMAIYYGDVGVGSLIGDSFSTKAPKYLRSLFFLKGKYAEDEGVDLQLMRSICSELQLLRVLVFHNAFQLKGKLASQVDKLMHLRYLSLKHSGVSELPSSIGNLRFLEILDLRVWARTLRIPNILWKLFRLRHLLLPYKYEIKGRPFEMLRIDTLIFLERIEGLQVKKLRTKGILKLKRLRELRISQAVSKEAMLDIMPAFKSGHLQECSLQVEGDFISSKNPNILADINVCSKLTIKGKICVPKGVDFLLPHYLKILELDGCQLEDDPMRISRSLCQLENLFFFEESYIGTKMSCSSGSFLHLTVLEITRLKNLRVWELEHGSMPKLEDLSISNCSKLNRIPDVLPLSLKEFESSDNVEDEKDGVNLDISSGVLTLVNPYGSAKALKKVVLEGECDKVVILGKHGVGKENVAMKHLYQEKDVNKGFDAVARTWVPSSSNNKRSSLATSTILLPRRNLQHLLRDLCSRDHHHDLLKMSCDDLISQIQQEFQQRKCLVILLNLEFNDFDHLEAGLEKIFGPRDQRRGMSKIVITSQSDIQAPASTIADCLLFKLCPPTTHLHTWNMLYDEDDEYCETNAGTKWNMMRHCPIHLSSVKLFVGLMKTKGNIEEWTSQHGELLTGSSPLEPSQIFELCYNDLPVHLRRCLMYLVNFPEDIHISTRKLYEMWIAAGLVESEQSEETSSLENVASTYLTQLVQREMVTVLRRGPGKRVTTCALKFALRDMCLAKAKEDPLLILNDQFDESFGSVRFRVSPTSLLFFTDADDPLYNEENWEWFVYICKHLQLLRVLDLQGMWVTRGSLPTEVGNLTHLRYLSLRGTWVTQLPPSIEHLVNLQTLDLRVMESIFIPDVLWKLDRLMHLYLPDSIAQDNPKLRLRGLKSLQTLVNLHIEYKFCLSDLVGLRLLRKISIRAGYSVEVVDELFATLNQQLTQSPSLEVSVNSKIINHNQTMLSRFNHLHKLKIKGPILEELHPGMLPPNLKELTLKYTKLEEDPLPVLEKLPELTTVFLDRGSFLGKTITFSYDFRERANLILRSLSNLEQVYSPDEHWDERNGKVEIIDCYRVTREWTPTENNSTSNAKSGCFDLSRLKNGLQSTFTSR